MKIKTLALCALLLTGCNNMQSLYPISMEWDEHVNELLDNGIVVDQTCCTIVFQHNSTNTDIWTTNYPYAYGMTLNENEWAVVIPTMKTRKRLKKYAESTGLIKGFK